MFLIPSFVTDGGPTFGSVISSTRVLLVLSESL